VRNISLEPEPFGKTGLWPLSVDVQSPSLPASSRLYFHGIYIMRSLLLSLAILVVLSVNVVLAGPCVSGLTPGQRPGPYSSLVSVGKERGQAHCFICETENRPAVVIFARSLDESLGKLTRGLDKALVDHKTSDLRAWVTFLNTDQATFDPKVVEWSKKQAIRGVPLSVFEDADGPPSYKLNREAEVTVLVFVKQKVVHNFAFRAGELTDERIADVLKVVAAVAGTEKK
jgi:hypothetical protein